MGIAIVMVMLFHLSVYNDWGGYDKSIIDFFFSRGNVGVDIFLFLSAYGLCYSYENNKMSLYYKNRFCRLFPMYFLFMLILLYFYIPEEKWVRVFFAQITGMATFMGMWYEWYIPALLLLYILFPFLFILLKKISSNFYAIFLSIALVVLSYPFIGKYIHEDFLRRIPIIIAGMLLYIKRDEKRYLLLIYSGMTALMFVKPDWNDFLYLPLLLWAIGGLQLNLPFRKYFSFMGRHSLELYLGQVIGLQYFYHHATNHFILYCVIGIGLSLLLAVIFYFGQKGFWTIMAKMSNCINKPTTNDYQQV